MRAQDNLVIIAEPLQIKHLGGCILYTVSLHRSALENESLWHCPLKNIVESPEKNISHSEGLGYARFPKTFKVMIQSSGGEMGVRPFH